MGVSNVQSTGSFSTSDSKIAPPGAVWVCAACGRTAPHRFGYRNDFSHNMVSGWDESCILNTVLCDLSSLKTEKGRVVYAEVFKPA